MVVAPLVGVIALAAGYLRSAAPEPDTQKPESIVDDKEDGFNETGQRARSRWDWVLPLGMLNVLFAVFLGVQATVLFRGDDYILGVGGPDYAEYARAGFTQLLTVVILILPIIAIAVRRALRNNRIDRALIRVLLGGLCVLTLLILASALHRLLLYADAYGFTRLRLLAAAVGVFLGLTLVCVIVAGVRLRAVWLPRVVTVLAAATLLGLAAVNPDALVADTVVHRFERDGHLDRAYLQQLTPDAVPAVNRLPEPDRSCLLSAIAANLGSRNDPWYAYNADRQRARAILKAHPITRRADCPSEGM
jgi:hypothetical protein